MGARQDINSTVHGLAGRCTGWIVDVDDDVDDDVDVAHAQHHHHDDDDDDDVGDEQMSAPQTPRLCTGPCTVLLYTVYTVLYCTVLYCTLVPPELCMPPEESEELHDKRTRARVCARTRARIMRARSRRPGTTPVMPCAPLTDPTPDSLVPLGLYRASYSLA